MDSICNFDLLQAATDGSQKRSFLVALAWNNCDLSALEIGKQEQSELG
ncbi:hypothetical protein FOXB_16171 [Fusarium oxysporum f. sp. conglutinans Fo5176]|uniref:Uncharacterized protein n=1 Tax=Fusarium oxysporum (strain Fo5176) TaxID=660025 RepID=F9GBY8_FUSOF|nr:hypothetical protein FOXB_16171 [Fusarium oxysporum f. sp. conglutinans Fo5176]